MKPLPTIIKVLALVATPFMLHAQKGEPDRLDAKLSPALRVQTLTNEPGILPHGRSLSKSSETSLLDLLVLTDGSTNIADRDFVVNSRVGNAYTATVPRTRLGELAATPGVLYIESAGLEQAATYSGAQLMNVVDVHQGVIANTPFTGRGVLVAIYDSGIDWSSPLFREPGDSTRSRIAAIWDQTMTHPDMPAPSGFSYGTEVIQPDIGMMLSDPSGAAAIAIDRTLHGTGVASIAAGSIGGIGVAPEASIVVIKGGDGAFSEARIIDALRYVDELAERMGMPVVVNLSLGNHRGPHDGSRLYEKAIDAFSARPGRIVVVSAGNEGGKWIHAETRFEAQGDSTVIPFSIPAYIPNAGDSNDNMTMEIWFDADDSLEVTLRTPSGHELVSTTGGALAVSNTTEGCLLIDNAAYGPSPMHGKNLAYIYASDFRDWLPASGTWQLRIRNLRDQATGTVHGWIVESSPKSFDAAFVGSHPAVTASALVRSPGNARSAITVGSIDMSPEAVTGSWFSSPGPSAGGLLKPDVAAPGNAVLTLPSRAQDHGLRSGTSYAAPHITGLIALILQSRPGATTEDIRELLRTGSATSTWSSVAGYGIPDGLEVMMAAAGQEYLAPELIHASLIRDADGVQSLRWRPRHSSMVQRYTVDRKVSGQASASSQQIASFPSTTPTASGQLSCRIPAVPSAGAAMSLFVTETDSLGRSKEFGEIHVTSTTAVLDDDTPILDNTMSTYPNPFNSMTTIGFTLRHPQKVRLDVFDILGRLIVTLMDSHLEGGRHTVPFEAGSLAAGVYVVRLTGPAANRITRINLSK